MTTYVGRSVPRDEDEPLVRGRGRYVDDVAATGMLYARFVRSQYPHAAITHLDVTAAARLDGVLRVLVAEDLNLPDLLPPVDNKQTVPIGRPILARDRLRFVGDAYALVLASDPYIAEDAAHLVDLEVQLLDAVVDPLAATDPDAPLLHPGHPSNVIYENAACYGDVDGAFRDAPIVMEYRIRSPRQTALPMEPRGMVAEVNDGVITLQSSTQTPHMVRAALAESLDMPAANIRVVVPDVGGGFGLKAHVYPEEVAIAAAARLLGRPIKWIEDRADNLTSSCHARDQVVDVRIAASEDGVLLALDVDLVCDVGAYSIYAHGAGIEASATPTMIPGPYDLTVYRYRTRGVSTNKCPAGAYRGVGLPVSTLVHERVMDLIASRTGIDPAEVRRRNLISAVRMPHVSITGQRYESGDYKRALETALAAIEYRTFAERQRTALAEGRLLGLGIACYVEYTAPGSGVFSQRGMRALKGFDEAHIALDEQGHATVHTTLPAAGQGLATTFRQMTADALAIPLEWVTVAPVDTGAVDLEGNGTFASRSAAVGGGAIMNTCDELRKRLLDAAADALEVAVTDLEIRDGVVAVVGAPESCATFGNLVARGPAERFAVSRRHDPRYTVYPYGTHACEIEVDPVSGQPRILRYIVADDCGLLINPAIVEGQVRGAVAQGLAGALYETVVYGGDGQPLTTSLMDYLVPTASEFPHFELHQITIAAPDSRNGTKGAGESGTLAPGAAVANAVSNALGKPCNSLPVSSEWARNAARKRLEVDHVRASDTHATVPGPPAPTPAATPLPGGASRRRLVRIAAHCLAGVCLAGVLAAAVTVWRRRARGSQHRRGTQSGDRR